MRMSSPSVLCVLQLCQNEHAYQGVSAVTKVTWLRCGQPEELKGLCCFIILQGGWISALES